MSTIVADPILSGSISVESSLTGSVSFAGVTLIGTLSSVKEDTHEEYTGVYEVSPLSSSATVLGTANKILIDDITVLKIRYQETTNTSDGLTAYIGE